MELSKDGFVFSYNLDPYRRTKYLTKAGDKIEWKRNGMRGGVKSVVVGFSENKPDFVLVQVGDIKRWIKKNSVLRVFA